jgi:hypothetical protein
MAFIARAGTSIGGGLRGRTITLAILQGLVAKTSFVNAIDDVFLVTAAFTLIALVPALFFKRSSRAGKGKAAVVD